MAVTRPATSGFVLFAIGIAAVLTLFPGRLPGAVLPEDRADVMGHYYEGGGLTVSGPAFLVRKGYDDKVSVSLEYYVDDITSASVDVVTTASEYTEHREETNVGVDYLYDSTLFNLGYTKSDETDYNADTYSLGVVQEVFGGLTTVSMHYAHGEDVITKSTSSTFRKEAERDQYSFGLSQVLTKSLLMSGSYELITDQGFLNNPYRVVRIGAATQPESYPETRRSHAASLTAVQHIFRESAIRLSYRYFWDTWNIQAHNVELGYDTYLFDRAWVVGALLRYYTQSAADFYADNFSTVQTYMARDKELSTFRSYSAGLALTYNFLRDGWGFIEKGSANAHVEYLQFKYDDFTDLRVEESTYGEPYEFDAFVVKLFLSLWY